MCGRYTLKITVDKLAERFKLAQEEVTSLALQSDYNVAPSESQPVIVVGEQGNEAALMRWGLIPGWSKDGKPSYSTINARAEGIAEKPTYRKPFRSRRCLVPAAGFYEWQATPGSKPKQPYYFTLKEMAESDLFAFAGLYDVWYGPDNQPLHSYTIITTTANELVAGVHNRMPVILPRDLEATWLDPRLQDVDRLSALLRPYPAAEMTAHPVSLAVNSPANNGPQLIAAAG